MLSTQYPLSGHSCRTMIQNTTQNKLKRYKILDFSTESPDLNPIQNVKLKIGKKNYKNMNVLCSTV